MRKKFNYVLVLLFYLPPSFADIFDYIFPYDNFSYSNYGSLGIIQSPSARFYDEGTLAFSLSHNDPYLRGSIVAYPFNWLETSFQYTEVNNELYSPVPEFSGFQTLKDKSFDAKIRILEESSTIPGIAVGFRDLGGTGRFASEYLVASKKIDQNLDITFGIGWGNLNGNKIKNPLNYLSDRFTDRNDNQELGGKFRTGNFFSGDAGYFAGAEYSFQFPRSLKFKIELDGTNYETESNPITQDSKINYGFSYSFSQRLIFKLSSTRGNTMNFGFSYSLNLGKKNPLGIQKEQRQKIDYPEVVQSITSKNNDYLYKASLLYLSKENGLSLQKAQVTDNELHVVISHAKFRSPAIAVGRTANILNQVSPMNIEKFKISEVNGGMGMYSVSFDRESYNRFLKFDSPESLNENIKSEPFLFDSNSFEYSPKVEYPSNFFSIGPELLSQIGGPDGFFFGDLKLNFDSEILFSRNFSLVSSFSYGIYDNMDRLKLGSDSVLPHVRTDIVEYLKQSRGFSIKRLQLNYYQQIQNSLFMKLSGGIFESMFSGYGLEFLYRPYHKNFGLGLDAWHVFQREYDQMFSVQDYDTLTGHLSFYYQEPRSNVLIHLKGGRYLAKDSGITVDFSRIFRSGFRLGAFFSLTDISQDEFGEGSFDKGFYFWIPVEIFSQRYFKKTFGWGLRPITRDGAQSLIYGYPLWGVTDQSSNHRLRRRISDIYD